MKYAIAEWEMRETGSDPCLSSRSASAQLWLPYVCISHTEEGKSCGHRGLGERTHRMLGQERFN